MAPTEPNNDPPGHCETSETLPVVPRQSVTFYGPKMFISHFEFLALFFARDSCSRFCDLFTGHAELPSVLPRGHGGVQDHAGVPCQVNGGCGPLHDIHVPNRQPL
jgi:hypothetical protein